MIHIPVLRHGQAYESIETIEIVHHATGESVASVSQANSGMIVRDVHRMADDALESFTVEQLLVMCRKAAERFMGAALPLGDERQGFDDYIGQLSATTGMPVSYCKTNAEKVRRVLADMGTIITGLTRGFDLGILDRGYGLHSCEQRASVHAESTTAEDLNEGVDPNNPPQSPLGKRGSAEPRASARADAQVSTDQRSPTTLSFYRDGRIFGAVLPSNSPGVHGLWIPAIGLKAPVVLKPGREEPWTPYRVIQALIAAGVPREVFGFYPTDHAGAGELLRCVDRSMLFGADATTRPWRDDPRVEIHGPGFSKVLLGDDTADDWERHVDLMASSIAANCGRSCINASGVWTPRNGRAIAEALADRLGRIAALPADDPSAEVAAFANPQFAEAISATIDAGLREKGAVEVTESVRGSSRLVKRGRCSYLLPTIIRCDARDHPLANREFLFPFASVVECPTAEMSAAIGPSLVVSAITRDDGLIHSLMSARNVDRLNVGAIPTWQLSWDQPHEGNLFEHLYRQRAFQTESAA